MRIRFGRFYIGSYYVPWWMVAVLGPLLLVVVAVVRPMQLISEIVEGRRAAKRRRRALARPS